LYKLLTVDDILDRVDIGGDRETLAEFLAQIVKEAEDGGDVGDVLGARLWQKALTQRQLAVRHQNHFAMVIAIAVAVAVAIIHPGFMHHLLQEALHLCVRATTSQIKQIIN